MTAGAIVTAHRLAIGVEPRDPVRRARVPWPLRVAADAAPRPLPLSARDRGAPPWAVVEDGRERLARRDSMRHVLLVGRGASDPFDVRITDGERRVVPRRLRLALPAPPAALAVRPALYPGAAYGPVGGAMGVRGRVLRDGAPMRWARVEARRTEDDALVGRAHGDDRGEFLLLLEAAAALGVDLILPLRVRITAFGPDVAPDPSAVPGAADDPLWDLPLEEVPLGPASEPVLEGEAIPPGYATRPNATREVLLRPEDGLRSETLDFS